MHPRLVPEPPWPVTSVLGTTLVAAISPERRFAFFGTALSEQQVRTRNVAKKARTMLLQQLRFMGFWRFSDLLIHFTAGCPDGGKVRTHPVLPRIGSILVYHTRTAPYQPARTTRRLYRAVPYTAHTPTSGGVFIELLNDFDSFTSGAHPVPPSITPCTALSGGGALTCSP